MKFTELNENLKDIDFINTWVQDLDDNNIYYYWKNESSGYKVNIDTMIVEIATKVDNNYQIVEDKELKSELNSILSNKIDELNKFNNFDEFYGKWLIDEYDESKYYYWKSRNSGYMAIVEDDGKHMPKIKQVQVVDGDYFEPSEISEFKNYKVKRLLSKELDKIKIENNIAKNKIFGMWVEDTVRENTFYFWKNEKEGYMAIVENNILPEIKEFNIVGNEYFEPRVLESISNPKIKNILDKKTSRR